MPSRPGGHVRQASLTKVSPASFRYVNLNQQPLNGQPKRQNSGTSASDFDSASPRSSSDSTPSSATSVDSHFGDETTSSTTEDKHRLFLSSPSDPNGPPSALLAPLTPGSEDDADKRWSRIMTDLGVNLDSASAKASPREEEEEIILSYQEEGELDSDSDTEPFSPSKRTSELPYRRPTYSWIELDKDKKRVSELAQEKEVVEEVLEPRMPAPRRPLPAIPIFKALQSFPPPVQSLSVNPKRREASVHSRQSSLSVPSRSHSPHPDTRTPSPAPSTTMSYTESSLPPHLRPIPRSRPKSRNSMTLVYRDTLSSRSNSPQLIANVRNAYAEAKGYQITDEMVADRRSKRASLISLAPSVSRQSFRNSVVHQSGEKVDKRRSFFANQVPTSDPFDRHPMPTRATATIGKSLPKRRYKPTRRRILQPSKNTASFFATRTRAWDLYDEGQTDQQQQHEQVIEAPQIQSLPYVRPESVLPPDLFHRTSMASLHHARTHSASSQRGVSPRPPSSSGHSHFSYHSRTPSAVFMAPAAVHQQMRSRPSMISMQSRQSAIMSSFTPSHYMTPAHDFNISSDMQHREQMAREMYHHATEYEDPHPALSRSTTYHVIDPLPQLQQVPPQRRRTLRKRRPVILRAQKRGIFAALFSKRKDEAFEEPLYIPSEIPRHPSRLF